MSTSQNTGGSARSGAGRAAPPEHAAAPTPPPRPGVFSAKGEKLLYQAIMRGDAIAAEAVTQEDPHFGPVADTWAAGVWLDSDPGRVRDLLARVWRSRHDPATFGFAQKYLPRWSWRLPLTHGVEVVVPVNRDAVGLLLAEMLQREGNLPAAIDVVRQVTPTAPAAAALCELYLQVGRYGDVIDITSRVENVDDVTAMLLVFRGAAFVEMEMFEAARQTLKEALRFRSRSPDVRHAAWIERARAYAGEGKRRMARKDLERVLAADSHNAVAARMHAELQEK